MDENTKAEAPAFADFLRNIEGGRLHADATEQYRELVHDMRQQALATGSKPKGKILLVLDVKLDGGVFEVRGDVRAVAPKKPREKTIFYADRTDNLTVINPAQQEFDMAPKDATGVGERSALKIAQ